MAPHLHRGTRAAAQWHSHNQSSHLLLSPPPYQLLCIFIITIRTLSLSIGTISFVPCHQFYISLITIWTLSLSSKTSLSWTRFFLDVWTLSCLISPLFHPLSWSVLIIEMTKLAILYESGPRLVAVLVKLCRHRRYTRPSAVSNQP